jgi:hypothetical protein
MLVRFALEALPAVAERSGSLLSLRKGERGGDWVERDMNKQTKEIRREREQ